MKTGFVAPATPAPTRGVDVVLNSLTGDAIAKGLEATAPGGRFIELGKVDVWSEERVRSVRPDVEYRIVDLEAVVRGQPEAVARLLREIEARLADGRVEPLPATTFDRAGTIEAFRYMAAARHVGKIVVMPADSGSSGRVAPRVRADATYLVAGGLGGIGLLVARWLADQGARSIVLMGRSAPSAHARELIEELSRDGVSVVVERGDVARAGDVEMVLARIDGELPPLRGVLQCVGVLDDGVLLQQDWSRFLTVLGPKVAGSWNLHRAVTKRELDFFCLFSSFVSLLGLRGQSNHAAACAFQDALAHHRTARGAPALSIDWGAWSGVGAAVDRNVIGRLAGQGILTIAPEEGMDALGRALRADDLGDQVAVARMDWPAFLRHRGDGQPPPLLEELAAAAGPPADGREARPAEGRRSVADALAEAPARQRRAVLTEHVRACAARVLGASPDSLDDRQPLGERGLDSLMAVELRGVLGRDLPLRSGLPATLLFDYPTVESLVGFLVRALPDPEGEAPTPESATRAEESALLLTDVGALTDEEAELALLRELDSGSGVTG